jgi:TPP-dependent pyruvate/acetoin dehydrogenase alpha subunit
MPPKSKDLAKQGRHNSAEARQKTPPAQSPVSFDSEKLKQLYSSILRCRMAMERARLLAKQGEIAADLGTPGLEAAEVGALIDLRADDCVAPGRRELVVRLIRGTALKTIFTRLYACQGAASQALANHAPQDMVAPAFTHSAQLNLVTGVAWSLKRHGKPGVALAFSGDDSASLAFWRDAVGFSVAHRLPIVHVVHNHAGDGSISAHLNLPAQVSATRQHPGFPAFTVDGNDVVAVYRVVQEAIRRARQGHGPALIECQTYRWSSQLDTDSRSPHPGAVELEQSTEPMARIEAYLRQKGLWSEAWKPKLVDRFTRELDAAIAFAKPRAHQPAGEINPSLATAS